MSNTNTNTVENTIPKAPEVVKPSNTKWWVLGGVVVAAAVAGAAYMLLSGDTETLEDITIGE